VSLRAAAFGVRVPDGIMAAYPVTTLQSTASPSRLLSIMDPLLPLSVLSKCVSAYSGEAHMLGRGARVPGHLGCVRDMHWAQSSSLREEGLGRGI
jgi:hypothetical protein